MFFENSYSNRNSQQYPVVDMTGDGSKIWCCEERYCIGTWNVRSINQDTLEVFKQEMARVNIDISRISELKWTGMDKFNTHDHYIYYCGQESPRRNGVTLIVRKRVWNTVLGCKLKNDSMISFRFQGKPFNITVMQVYAPTRRSWSWTVLWRPTRPSRTNTQKRCPFHHGGMECQSRKSRYLE